MKGIKKKTMDLIRFPGMMTGLRNLPLTAALLLGGCFGPGKWGDGPQTTIRPETDTGRVIQEIYALVTWISIGIFIVVAGLMIYALVRYRARDLNEWMDSDQAEPANVMATRPHSRS